MPNPETCTDLEILEQLKQASYKTEQFKLSRERLIDGPLALTELILAATAKLQSSEIPVSPEKAQIGKAYFATPIEDAILELMHVGPFETPKSGGLFIIIRRIGQEKPDVDLQIPNFPPEHKEIALYNLPGFTSENLRRLTNIINTSIPIGEETYLDLFPPKEKVEFE